MTSKKIGLLILGAAVLAAPIAASAQQYEDRRDEQQGYDRQAYDQHDNRQGYGRDRDDDQERGNYGRGQGYGSYPQFRGFEQHIREAIMSAVREDIIERDDARDLMTQLRRIQYQEQREFRVHGWNLPQDHEERLREQLRQLDHRVDEVRGEQ